jgi:hypothetical protein
MKQDPFANVYRALTPKELAEMFMNPNAPKTEAEHWAVREIERLRAEIERLRAALQESACACSSIRECASEWAKDGKCPHADARNALEGKP